MNHTMLITELKALIDKTLRPLIERSKSIALLDHPNHPNVGDSAIWLGEQKFLERHDIKTAYKSDLNIYDEKVLRKKIGSNTILIHGGGNFGDIYGHHHDFRLSIIRAFTQNRIIQLPQSLHFSSQEEMRKTAEAIAQHDDFHLLCRDQHSYNFSTKHFDCHVYLCPDMAFYIDSVTCQCPARQKFGFLSRTDSEATSQIHADSFDFPVFDWLEDDGNLAIKLNSLMTRQFVRRPSVLRPFHKAIEKTYDKVALARFNRGIQQLCESEIIITNRLHGHILCLLLGKKHYFLDNNYGKLSRFHDLWTKHSDIAIYCTDEAEAIAKTTHPSVQVSNRPSPHS